MPAVVALLRDDPIGAARETGEAEDYLAAFRGMQRDSANRLIVGEIEAQIVATYQITVIAGLSLRATRRAQIESVRVASRQRAKGIGAALLRDAETRARAAGCRLMQLTSDATRTRARAFYEGAGFTASHVGFKKPL